MTEKLKLGCVVLERNVEKKVQTTINKLCLEVKVFSYKTFETLMVNINKDHIDYIFVDIDSNRENLLHFLKILQDEFPHVIRVLVIDLLTDELVLMANNLVHLMLEKKYLEETLRKLFIKAEKLRRLLKNQDLIKMINSFNNLVVLKQQHIELLQYMNKHDSSNKEISRIIEKNIVLSTKILQVANMAIFTTTERIKTVSNAVVFLGLDIIRALIINMQVFSFDSGKGNIFRHLALLECHCQNIAEYSKIVAAAFNATGVIQNHCFTAGLLHDIGKLVMMDKVHNWDNIQKLSYVNDLIIWKAEEAFLGTTHAHVGAYFLGIWNFPDEIVEAVAFHHDPSASETDTISCLTFVHIAEAMLKNNVVSTLEEFERQLDMDYLNRLGIRQQTIDFYKSYLGLDEPHKRIELAEDSGTRSGHVKIEVLDDNG